MATAIFTPENVIEYAETRLFGSNVGSDDVHSIELHNAVLPSELVQIIIKNRDYDFSKVEQENGREPIFFHDGTLYLSQYSGFGRRQRYEDMIKAYIEVTGKDITFSSHDRWDNPKQTGIWYGNFAYDFVKAFSRSPGSEDITTFVIGPTDGFAKQATIIEKRDSEYLDSQILDIAGTRALNMDYVYADQAGLLLEKLLRDEEAIASTKDKRRKIRILMMGRVGSLEPIIKHSLIYPTSVIDEVNLMKGRTHLHKVENILDDGTYFIGANLNVRSVIGETREQLLAARQLGCVMVEMESSEALAAIEIASRRYHRHLDIEFGFVGHVSDLPLQGDTLAKELDSDLGERRAVKKIIDHIKFR